MKALFVLSLGLFPAVQQGAQTPAGQSAPPASARQQETVSAAVQATTTFALDQDASLVRGCFPPCLCPLVLLDDLRGTFDVARVISQDPDFRAFRVTNVSWFAGSGNGETWITGGGEYRVGTQGGQAVHQLVLDLAVDDAPVRTFDSGLVAGGAPGTFPPAITITIDSGQDCYDHVFTVSAQPLARADFLPYELTESAGWFSGCFPPCACPISARNVVGTFALTPSTVGATTTEFSIARVDWRYSAFTPIPTPGGEPIPGAGRYVLGEDDQVRLQLFVSEGSAAGRYDSGWMESQAAFPSIGVSTSEGDLTCFDRGFYVHADPLP